MSQTMSCAVALAILLTGCVECVTPPAADAGLDWVPAQPYCDRIEALGCDQVCSADLCDRDRADACLAAVEAAADDCDVVPAVLSEPVCRNICVALDGGTP